MIATTSGLLFLIKNVTLYTVFGCIYSPVCARISWKLCTEGFCSNVDATADEQGTLLWTLFYRFYLTDMYII